MKIIDFTIGRKKNGRVVNTTIYHPKKLPDDNKLKSTYFGIGSKRIGITFIYIKANGEARSIKRAWGNSPKYYFGASSSFDKAKTNVKKWYKIRIPSRENFEKVKFKHYAKDDLNDKLIRPAEYVYHQENN